MTGLAVTPTWCILCMTCRRLRAHRHTGPCIDGYMRKAYCHGNEQFVTMVACHCIQLAHSMGSKCT